MVDCVKRVNNLVDDHEEVVENPLVEKGWEYKDANGSVRGIYPSEVIYQWRLKGSLGNEQKLREVGTTEWTLLVKHEALIKQRAVARTAWRLFSHEPQMVWYYRDAQDEIQGPFASGKMWNWFEGGLLFQTLMVSVIPQGDVNIDKEKLEFLSLNKLLEALMLEEGACPSKLLLEVIKRTNIEPSSRDVEEKPLGNEDHSFGLGGNKGDVLNLPLEKLAPISRRLWMPRDQETEWFFTDKQVIYGPYGGAQMYVWFCEGYLPEGLKIFSREVIDEDTELCPQREDSKMTFVPLGDALYNVVQHLLGTQ